MKAFTIRWRGARRHREYELQAAAKVAVPLVAALQASGGMAAWQEGTLWKCPGCDDRTVKTEASLEGMHRAEVYLRQQASQQSAEGSDKPTSGPALEWLELVAARMLGCERDRVYIKDESGGCTYQTTTYTSRI